MTCEACNAEADEMRTKRAVQWKSMQHNYAPLFCDACEKHHVLMPGNRLALRIFEACHTQLILGPEGQIVGLRNEAIWAQIAAELRRSEPHMLTFQKVKAAEAELASYDSDRRKRDRRKRDAEQRRKETQRKMRRH